MQPPAVHRGRDGCLAPTALSRDRKSCDGSPNKYTAVSVVEDSHNDLQRDRHRQSETRNVLSGRLSRCAPVFSPSSDMVLCSCSSSVLGVSVETGEQLIRLEGHSADVTGMLLLPPGVYGGNDAGGDNKTRHPSHGRHLLTSSIDGTMRVWDISVNLLSLEDERDRCLRVFRVGRPVHHLYLGRQDSSGAALDVIIVTKERNSFPDNSVVTSTELKDSEHGKDKEEDDNKGNNDGDSVDEDDDIGINNQKKSGALELKRKAAFFRGKGMKNGMQHLIGWKVTRYGIAPGVATSVIVEALDQRRQWVGAVSALSPLRSSGSDGVSKRLMAYPILLTADGRNVIARDTETGDEAHLLRSFGRICKMVVCDGGDSLVTGHTEGSMAHWQGLQERIGAAFRVSGYEGARKQPVAKMHWHASAVGCMDVASNGVQMFSGGQEAVLVQWNLSKGTKAFIPRLGSPLKELTVSPAQEHVVVCSTDNAITLVGLAEWDVLWQMRGLALSAPSSSGSAVEEAFCHNRALRLTLEPKCGLLACNGRPGHLQFYNVGSDCLEASVEVEWFNRDSSGKTYFTKDLEKKRGSKRSSEPASASLPVVERVAFSRDGKRMVAVASRPCAAGSRAIPRLSFWKHVQGSDPYKTSGYVGSYDGARSTRKNVKGDSSGGTWGHWAPDTSVDNPHGPGKVMSALEYHPGDDVVVTAGEDGEFNLWGLKRSADTERSLAAHPYSSGGGKAKEEPVVHWACSLSIRYKEGFSATSVSFSSDGSVLAVAYTPEVGKLAHSSSHGVITLWSLDTITLVSTLLTPRALDIPSSMPQASLPRRVESVAFLSGCGRIFASGDNYAAVWDLFLEEPAPLWEYRGRFLATATADAASAFRSGKSGVNVAGQGLGDVVLCVDAESLAGETKKQGSVVLLLDSRSPTPLYTWRLPYDNPSCVRLLLGGTHSGGKEGVLCLTRRGELLLLSVASEDGDVSTLSPAPKGKPQIGAQYGLGVIQSKRSAKAPGLHTGKCNNAMQKLLDVDLSATDPSLTGRGEGRKRPRFSGGTGDGHEDEDVGHAGGKEVALRSEQQASDILDPSSLNLPPVSDLYEPFMKTLLKPAPRSSQKAWEGHPLLKEKGKKRQGSHGSATDARKGQRPMGVDKGLLEALTEEMKVAGTGS